jgi:hypothetical protein
MRVRILSDVSDHRGTYAAGGVFDLPDAVAKYLLERGHAEVPSARAEPEAKAAGVTTKAELAKSSEAPEAATLGKPDERATLPSAKKRGEE